MLGHDHSVEENKAGKKDGAEGFPFKFGGLEMKPEQSLEGSEGGSRADVSVGVSCVG